LSVLLKASFEPLIAKLCFSEMPFLSFPLNFYISEAMPLAASEGFTSAASPSSNSSSASFKRTVFS
jgi:hypothetical protein